MAGYRAFARFLAAFDNELGRAGSGGSGGRGCVTVSNVRYAGACARVASPSVRVAARLETLAEDAEAAAVLRSCPKCARRAMKHCARADAGGD